MNLAHVPAAPAFAILFGVFALAPVSVCAQRGPATTSAVPAATPPSRDIPSDETVTLSAFEVTADANDSYEALNTASVTGTNRSIRSLPVTMNAYTRTFLDEIDAVELSQVLSFTPNVTLSLDAGEGGAQPLETMRLRGITSKEERRRNGFLSLAKSDMFSTERIEILRGAQALLYGQGTAGGVVNTVTKRATEGIFTEASFMVSDAGTRRLILDHNHTFGHYSIRAVGLTGRTGFWQDNLEDKPLGLYVDAVRRFGRRFALRASHEYLEEDARYRHRANTIIRDNTRVDPRTGESLDRLLYTGGDLSGILIGGEPVSYENFRSAQTPVTRRRSISNTTVVALEGTFTSDLSARIAWEYQDIDNFYEQGTTDLLAPTDTNAVDDQWSIRLDPMRTRNKWHIWGVQAAAVWKSKVGSFLKNQLVVGGENRLKHQFFLRQQLFQVDATGNFLPGSSVVGRSQAPITYAAVQNRYPNGITPYPGYAWGDNALLDYLPHTPDNPRGLAGTGLALRVEKQLAGYVNWLGTWFDERLESMAGIRVDQVVLDDVHVGQNLTDTTEESGTVGIVYNITPNFGIYANASRSFAAAGTFSATPDNTFPGPGSGLTKEAGLKFDLWKKRISGSLAFYDNRGENEAIQMNNAIRDKIDPPGINGRFGGTGAVADVTARGVELVLTAQPVRGWRIWGSLGTNDATITSNYSHATFYNDQFNTDGSTVKVRQADGTLVDHTVAVNPSQPNGPRTPLTIAMMRDPSSPYFAQLDSVSGHIRNAPALGLTTNGVGTGNSGLPITQHQLGFVAPNGGIFEAFQSGDLTTPNAGRTVSGNTNYDFRGAWKNFSVGGSVNWQSRIRQGYATRDGTRQVYYAPDFAIASLRLNYRLRLDRQNWKLQLTVQNVFDTQPVVRTLDANGSLNSVNVQQPPRTLILTVSTRF
jgi:outer membrane receptor protein involved in Fe transport